MISDENILIFLCFLFFILFFVLLRTSFNHIWVILKIKEQLFWCPCSLPLYKEELFLRDLAFFLNSILHGTSREDLAFFSLNSILNCLLMRLHFKLLQIVLLTLSCGAGRREVRMFVGGRVYGIAPCVPSITFFPS